MIGALITSHSLYGICFPSRACSGAALPTTQTHNTTVLPSTRSVGHKGKMPSTAEASFVAPNASVIGDVKVSRKAAECAGKASLPAVWRSSGPGGTHAKQW